MTTNYIIFGEEIPIETKIYYRDNNIYRCVSRNNLLDLSISYEITEDMEPDAMEKKIVSSFERTLFYNMKSCNMNSLKNFLEFKKNKCARARSQYKKDFVIFEMPDENDSYMIGTN